MKLRDVSWPLQGIFWIAVVSAIGWFSKAPMVEYVPADQTMMKLVIRTSGKLVGECRSLSDDELDRLPANMRQTQVCPREKSPLYAELSIGEELLYRRTVEPSGLHSDGVIADYQQFRVDAGPARIRFGIRDDSRDGGFTHLLEREVTLSADRILTIHFDDSGFTLDGA